MAETETQQAEAQDKVNAQNAEFSEVSENQTSGDEPNLDILLDINMPVTVVIGKTEVPFRNLLQLGPDAVLQLDKPVGQPAELYVQDIKFATGDIVVVDDCFAVRIKEVLGMDEPDKSAASEE
jgi:flagellar motor switch protein FliN/FliY